MLSVHQLLTDQTLWLLMQMKDFCHCVGMKVLDDMVWQEVENSGVGKMLAVCLCLLIQMGEVCNCLWWEGVQMQMLADLAQ